MERSESIAKLIIMSYTIAIVVLLLANSLVNFFSVSVLEKMMQYYTVKNLEHEAFIPLPFFTEGSDKALTINITSLDLTSYDDQA
jgi:hypothetical protein